VAVGVAFIILMPIIGLILCLCRCAGHCGGKRRHDDVAKDNRCRRATCGLLLLILATLITYVCYVLLRAYLFITRQSYQSLFMMESYSNRACAMMKSAQ